jgi:tetratricopeptide (TPR) repeat protein
MALFAKIRAQGHYNTGTRIMSSLLQHGSSNPANNIIISIKNFQQAVDLDPNFAEAFHNLGYAWYQASEYNIMATYILNLGIRAENAITDCLQTALNSVDRAIAIRYEFPQAHNTRSMILAKLDRLNEAIEASDIAIFQKPDYKNALDNLEKMKRLKSS